MAGGLGGTGAVDPGAPTINAKKHRQRAPLGGAVAGDLGAPVINSKKHQWWPPRRCQSWRPWSIDHQR
jgi:hypothetical protein